MMQSLECSHGVIREALETQLFSRGHYPDNKRPVGCPREGLERDTKMEGNKLERRTQTSFKSPVADCIGGERRLYHMFWFVIENSNFSHMTQ